MIHLFPKCRSAWIAALALALLVGAAVWHESRRPFLALGLAVLVVVLGYLYASAQALRMHSQILSYYYTQLKPKDFAEGYTLLLKDALLRPNVRFSMLSNLASAYTAAGDYEKAEAVLDEAAALPVAARPKPQAMLVGSRCNLCCAQGRADGARTAYAKLEEYSHTGTIVPQNVLGQYRVRLALLEGTAAESDIDLVRETMKHAGSELQRTNMKFLLGRLYAALDQPEFARPYLAEVSECGDQMVIASQAKCLLETIK